MVLKGVQELPLMGSDICVVNLEGVISLDNGLLLLHGVLIMSTRVTLADGDKSYLVQMESLPWDLHVQGCPVA